MFLSASKHIEVFEETIGRKFANDQQHVYFINHHADFLQNISANLLRETQNNWKELKVQWWLRYFIIIQQAKINNLSASTKVPMFTHNITKKVCSIINIMLTKSLYQARNKILPYVLNTKQPLGDRW